MKGRGPGRPDRSVAAWWAVAVVCAAVTGVPVALAVPATAPPSTNPVAVAPTGLPGANAPGAMDEVAFLPIAVRGRWTGASDPAATAAARAATSRAATATASTATASAVRTASSSPSPTQTGSATATVTPWNTLTPRPSPTPIATATDAWAVTPQPIPSSAPEQDRLEVLGERGYGAVQVESEGSLVRLEAAGAAPIAYELDFTHPDNKAGRLTVREVASNRFPVAGAGLYYQTSTGAVYAPRLTGILGRAELVEHSVLVDGVAITVTERLEGAVHLKSYTVRLQGRTLRVRLRSLDGPADAATGGYMAAGTGLVEGTRDGVNVRLPLVEAIPITMVEHQWFVSSLHDPTFSSADDLAPRGPEQIPGAFVNETLAYYSPDTGGSITPVDETFLVTVSPDVSDAFPVAVSRTSPHDGRLTDRALVTLENQTRSFDDDAAYLESLRRLRMDDLLVVRRGWRDAASLPPAQSPPDAARGGTEAFTRLQSAAPALLPELDYTRTEHGCPGEPAPLYSDSDRITASAGNYKTYPDETRSCSDASESPAYLLAPSAALRLARAGAGAPDGSAGAFLTSLATWNPGYAAPGAEGNMVDRAAGTSHGATVRSTLASVKSLLSDLQASTGPVLADGAYGPWELGGVEYLAGYVDGVTGEFATGNPDGYGGSWQLVAPDFAFSDGGARTARFGVGSYDRFFGPVTDTAKLYPLSAERLDELRATQISFGFGAAWAVPEGAPQAMSDAEQAREYFLVKPIAERLRAVGVRAVHYVTESGAELTLSDALRADLDVYGPRLRLEMKDGGSVWVNHSTDDWRVIAGGMSYVLPTHGWLVDDPLQGLLAYSAVTGGRRTDFLSAPEWTVLDGRGEEVTQGALTTRDLVVQFLDGVKLVEAADGSLSLVDP